MELEEEREKRKKRDFNLGAMKQLIDENGFLKSKYDKLSINAEERFGYHWNEVICNVLYNKYVKSNEELLERYKALKVKHDIEKDRTDVKDARPDVSAYGVNDDENKDQIVTTTENMKNKQINEMSAGGGNSVGDGAPTGNASGAYEGPAAFSANNKSRKFFKNTMVRGAKIVGGKTPDNNMTMKESTSLVNQLCEEFGSLITEFEQNFKPAEGQSNTSTQPKVLTYHIVTNNEHEFYADVRDDQGNTVYEINSLEELNKLMTQGMSSKEDVEGLSAILKSQGKMQDSDVLELAELNESPSEIKPCAQTLGLVNEEVKPNGLVQADRIKAINQQNSLNYYKTLNPGIQDMIKIEKPNNVEITATIKYEFDNNGQDVANGVFPDAEKYNTEYQETAHRGMEDLILDRPDAKYDERLKKSVGTPAYNILKAKQQVIMNQELRNTPPGRFKTVPDKTIDALKESYLSGYYLDGFNNKKIKTTTLSKIVECEVLSEGVKFFETKGLGNSSSEILKEEIETYNFYFDLNEGTVVKIKKDLDSNKKETTLNESVIKKVKYLTSYDPSINVKNIVDHSKL